MVFAVAAMALTWHQEVNVRVDSFGVSQIVAPDVVSAMRAMGRIVAQDRLWQMEMSRRSAQGQLAEVLGPSAVASDTETLKRAYTPDEYEQMFRALPAQVREGYEAYAQGVNDTIKSRTESGTLPPGYAANGIAPRPWTTTDTCAIAVMMSRRFGSGGAGELRNYAVYQYLQLRPIKDRSLDVLDDLLWFNDPDSPVTVALGDDPIVDRPAFHFPTRQETSDHLAGLPKTGLLELAGAVSAATYEENALIAQTMGVPYKTGSYAVVVAPRRSKTRNPLLLGAPQMGHTNPNVVHEISIDTPSLKVSGMNVPGIPGVLIGNTPSMAWTLTSGVADGEDVIVSTLGEGDRYTTAGQTQTLETVPFTLKVKGQADRVVNQLRTVHGPVLLLSRSSKSVYSLKSALWKRELSSLAAFYDVAKVTDVRQINDLTRRISTSFNFFFAFRSGEIGYRYVGLVPLRPAGVDPRFPTPDTAANQWQGFVSAAQMPRVDNPASGVIANWNNKPVGWWPNFDTPAWGMLFRSTVLNRTLVPTRLGIADLELAAWTIARQDTEGVSQFIPVFRGAMENQFGLQNVPEPARQLAAFDGWQTEGSVPAALYRETLRELRKELFLADLGNLTQDALFEQAVQASVIWKAMHGSTKVDWRKGRTPEALVQAAYEKAVANLTQRLGSEITAWGFRSGTMPDPNGPRIPYNNRGTYIQLTELTADGARAQSVSSPGIAESGQHSADQAPLARAWTYKPVWNWNSPADPR